MTFESSRKEVGSPLGKRTRFSAGLRPVENPTRRARVRSGLNEHAYKHLAQSTLPDPEVQCKHDLLCVRLLGLLGPN